MPFSRRSPLTASTVLASALATAAATLLVGLAPVVPAHAEQTPADPATAEQTPAEQTPTALVAPITADTAVFCPRPTGKWWEDVTAHGCVEVLAGRDRTTPLTGDELGWLDLGDLPAYATIDIDAIGASIAAYEQRLADEAAEEAAAAAAEEAARQAAAREREAAQQAARQRSVAMRRTFAPGELDAIAARCGFTPGNAPTPEQDACLVAAMSAPAGGGPAPAPSTGFDDAGAMDEHPESAAHTACLDIVGGDPDLLDHAATYAYFDAVARCVDARIPGYHARWVAEEAERQAAYEEGRRRDAAAWAAFQARVEAAREEAAATCPNGGLVSYFAWMVKSYDEVEIRITCR